MTVKDVAEQLNFSLLAGGSEQTGQTVSGCYIGDLLSWVMARALEGNVWITVMGNVNAIAVASLTDCACIVLAESAALDEDARLRADQQGIPVYSSSENSYHIAVALSRLLDA